MTKVAFRELKVGSPTLFLAFFGAWWFCWIVSNILDRLESRADRLPNGLGPATIPIGIASTTLGVAAAVLAIMVVFKITRVQEDRISSRLQ